MKRAAGFFAFVVLALAAFALVAFAQPGSGSGLVGPAPGVDGVALDSATDDGGLDGGIDSGFDSGVDGGTCTAMWEASVCSESGQTGCAGGAGTGGNGGHGGGAAIALFVGGASDVTVSNGGFFTGIGGNGGNGGTGGNAGNGMPGSTGIGTFCHTTCGITCVAQSGTFLEGGAGGGATKGGAGGNGGGGAGGPTYFYATYGDAGLTISPATLTVSQHKGAGGPGGWPNGPDAGQADHP